MLTGAGSPLTWRGENRCGERQRSRAGYVEAILYSGSAAFGDTFGDVGAPREKGAETEKEVVMETGLIRLQEHGEGSDERRL